MFDWYLILTPLLVLPIVVLFAFVGCAIPHNPLPVRLKLLIEPEFHVTSVQFDVALTATGTMTSTATRIVLSTSSSSPTITGANDIGADRQASVDSSLMAYQINGPTQGTWSVTCTVTLEGARLPLPISMVQHLRVISGRTQTDIAWDVFPDAMGQASIIPAIMA